MSDSTLNYFLAKGTAAQRAAFTPSPPSPANAPPAQGYSFYETDTGKLYAWDGAAWQQVGGSGGAFNVGLSAGTQSVSTGTVVFSNSNGVSFGMSGSSRITASVAAQTNQTVGVYASSNTTSSVSSGTVDARSLTFVGAGGVSVGYSNGSVILSGGAGGGGGGSVNFSAGTTSNNLTAITFSNSNGVSFGLNASTMTASVATSLTNVNVSAGTTSNNLSAVTFSNSNGVSFGLNASTLTASVATSLTNVNVSAGTTSNNLSAITFSNLNGVSFGLNGSTLTASVAAAGGVQTGISGIVVSNTTYTSGTVSFSNAGNITISSSTNGATQYIVLSGNAAQTNQSAIKGFGVSNTGNTAGNTGLSTGIDWVLAASNSLTLSQSTAGGGPNTVWVQVGAYLTTAMQSNAATISNINISGGTTSSNLSNFKLIDSNGVSWSLDTGSKIYATVKTDYQTSGAYLTTADLSQNSSKYVQNWKLTGNTAGTTSSAQGTDLWFSGGNSITVSGSSNTIVLSVGNYITTADLSQNSSKYVQNWKLTGNTAGTTSSAQGTDLWFSGGNSITVSGSSNTVVFSVGNYLTTAALSGDTSKYVQNWKLTGNTAGTTSSAEGTDLWFSGGNSITVSGSSNTIVLSVGNYLTTADLSQNSSKYVQNWKLTGNTAGTTSSAQGTDLWFSGGANVTVSGSSNTILISAGSAAPSPVNFSAGTTSNNLGSVVFSDSNGISWGLSGSTITGTVSTYSTVGTATTVYDVASASSNGTVTRWAAEDHKHAGIGAIGISTGNTLGTSGSKYGTYWLAGSGGLSVSQSTSNNGSNTIIFSANQVGFNGFLEPYPLLTATATFAPVAGSYYLAPFTAYGSMSGGRINMLAVNTGTANLFQDIGETAYKSATTGTLNQSYTFSAAAAIFSQGTGANSTRLESVWSNSHSWGWSKVLNVSTNAATNIAVSLAHSLSYMSDIGSDGGLTNVQYANAGSSTIANSSGASTALSTVFSSGRNIISGSLVQPIPFNTTLTAGIYWLGYVWSSTRSTATTGALLGSAPDFGFSGLLGNSRLEVNSLYRNFGSTATAARSAQIPYGVYTGAAAMAPPANVAISSDLSSLASQWVPYFNWNLRGLTK